MADLLRCADPFGRLPSFGSVRHTAQHHWVGAPRFDQCDARYTASPSSSVRACLLQQHDSFVSYMVLYVCIHGFDIPLTGAKL
jgi:hypothetical protein